MYARNIITIVKMMAPIPRK